MLVSPHRGRAPLQCREYSLCNSFKRESRQEPKMITKETSKMKPVNTGAMVIGAFLACCVGVHGDRRCEGRSSESLFWSFPSHPAPSQP